MTKEELNILLERVKANRAKGPSSILGVVKGPRARAKKAPVERGMNGAEKKYEAHLEALKRAGKIYFYGFECFKLRIAEACQYIPDFLVIDNDGYIELHDVKAKWKGATGPHIEDDALVKMKVAGEMYPAFTTMAVWLDGDQWQQRRF